MELFRYHIIKRFIAFCAEVSSCKKLFIAFRAGTECPNIWMTIYFNISVSNLYVTVFAGMVILIIQPSCDNIDPTNRIFSGAFITTIIRNQIEVYFLHVFRKLYANFVPDKRIGRFRIINVTLDQQRSAGTFVQQFIDHSAAFAPVSRFVEIYLSKSKFLRRMVFAGACRINTGVNSL